MSGWEPGFTSFWWLCPFFMFIMMLVACFMMRSCCRGKDRPLSTRSAEETLEKRFVLGENDNKNHGETNDTITVQHRRPEQ